MRAKVHLQTGPLRRSGDRLLADCGAWVATIGVPSEVTCERCKRVRTARGANGR